MKLYLAIDISDDDVELTEVAQQCGFDVRHSVVLDLTAPVVAVYHDSECLMLELQLSHVQGQGAPAADILLTELEVVLSHPSVSAVRKLALEP
ncbi:hypothetical protein [Rheinheimera sp. 4Y26]|uniref:hypothetical protein n=1 Tax=Rheinheimera sp. 4Y26 TaxID=2977811 RepID=UPI0021B14954|nr:hypothetical protein [Rheinheimera sp. 4Y26]MCT6699837.1 hypothetical protein [Rheinheimera sp. 4Y26]